MKNLLSYLSLFLCFFILIPILGQKVSAAPHNFEIETLQFEVPTNTYKGGFVDLELSGGNLPQTYTIGYGWWDKNCGFQLGIDATCSDRISIPEIFNQQLGTNISLSENQTYTLKITGAYHLLSNSPGSRDPSGKVDCIESNCTKLFAGLPFTRGATLGTVKMRWTADEIESPDINVNPETIGLTGQSSVKISKLSQAGIYNITLYDSRERQKGNAIGATSFQVKEDGTCSFSKNDLNVQCAKASGSTLSEGTFVFKPPNIQNPTGDLTYIVQVTVRDKSATNATPLFQPSANIIVATGVTVSDFALTVKTTPILANKDQQVTVNISETKSAQKYNIKLTTSLGDINLPSFTSDNGGSMDYRFNTKQGSNFLFRSPGSYKFEVTEEGTGKKGVTNINVESDKDADGKARTVNQNCLERNNCSNAAGIVCDINNPNPVPAGQLAAPFPAERMGILTALGCIPTDPKMFLEKSLPVAFGASGGIAFLLMIFGAFQMITSAGNPDNVKKGREQFNSAIIGLVFILFSVLLLEVVGFNILNIPGFGR